MMKLMSKRLNKKGFTLAELLIVVAIIAVLVAIAIPIFTAQLEKSRESTDAANLRSACSELQTKYLSGETPDEIEVKQTQTGSGWNDDLNSNLPEAIREDVANGKDAAPQDGDGHS